MKANKLEATAYDNFKAFGKKKKRWTFRCMKHPIKIVSNFVKYRILAYLYNVIQNNVNKKKRWLI